MIRTTQNQDAAKAGLLGGAKVWISLSLFLSFSLMAWSFSLPFRDNRLTSQQKEKAEQSNLQSSEVKISKRQMEEMRDAAVSLDHALMKKIGEKYAEEEKPGHRETQNYWNRHVESVRRQVMQIGQAPEGSLESQYQRELLDSLGDGPRE
ncbi:hypothetical protein N9D23_09820 [Rubripirellula sp.]|nr:hypothetical protein [Planctomycetaceae bacterium]MDA9858408.1 hypothetical protein [Rubripirellula sp.]MDF1844222.1 hypothetical protein [Rubripirellula sp.]